ncbi:MAG: hypothetical protein ACJA1L_001640 [Paracoccaceae bacterium]|jgi:hypothetical protein
MTEHEGGVARRRTATIRIRRLSFNDGGHRDARRYDWTQAGPAGKVLFDERYFYAPASASSVSPIVSAERPDRCA